MKDLLMAFYDGWRECGDVVYYDVPRPMLALTRPEYVQYLMDEEWETHRRSSIVQNRLKDILGEGVMNLGPDEWRSRYRIVEPALREWRKTDFEGTVVRTTEEAIDRWRPNEPLDAWPEMVRLGLDIGGNSMFGDLWAPAADRTREAFIGLVEYLIPRVTGFPFRIGKLRPVYRRSRRDLSALDEFLHHAIAERRRQPADDLTSLLVQSKDPDTGQSLTDKQLRDELATRMFGFYKGVPPVMTWMWWELGKHPEHGDRVRAEVADGGSDLTYTTRVVHEVLRMYPPIFLMSRPPDQDEEIGGYHIPKGVLTVVNPYITGRHPEFWERPEEFDPERFNGQSPSERPYTYFPFGAGPRKCDSEWFGFTSLKLILATVSRRYRLDVPPDHEIERKSRFILRPSNGMPVIPRPI